MCKHAWYASIVSVGVENAYWFVHSGRASLTK
jgi:hypothetical protein